MNSKHYYLDMRNNHGEIVYLDYNKLNGFKITPKNQIKYDGIMVNKLILIKPSFIEKVLKKKINHKLKAYLEYFAHILETIDADDEDDGALLDIALNDLDRYRRTIYNTYQKFLDDKYVKALLAEIKEIEKELRIKQAYLISYQMDNEKSSGRRSR